MVMLIIMLKLKFVVSIRILFKAKEVQFIVKGDLQQINKHQNFVFNVNKRLIIKSKRYVISNQRERKDMKSSSKFMKDASKCIVSHVHHAKKNSTDILKIFLVRSFQQPLGPSPSEISGK